MRRKPWVSSSSGALWASFSRQGEKDAFRQPWAIFSHSEKLQPRQDTFNVTGTHSPRISTGRERRISQPSAIFSHSEKLQPRAVTRKVSHTCYPRISPWTEKDIKKRPLSTPQFTTISRKRSLSLDKKSPVGYNKSSPNGEIYL